MTSSSRHIKQDEPRWNPNRHQFKDHDPLCEPGLISILFLAHGNHEVTKYCLESTRIATRAYENELEFCFLENGLDNDNWSLFQQYPCERKKLIRSSNWGIMSAFNDLWSVSRGEYCLILENDFWNSNPNFNFLQVAKDILDQNTEVGMVHLRAIRDPFEHWGFGKKEYCPFSIDNCENTWTETTLSGHQYMTANYPNKYCNNPNLMRKTLWRECGYFNEPVVGSCPKHNETHYQERINKTDCIAAHILTDTYYHVGGSAKSQFLRNGGRI